MNQPLINFLLSRWPVFGAVRIDGALPELPQDWLRSPLVLSAAALLFRVFSGRQGAAAAEQQPHAMHRVLERVPSTRAEGMARLMMNVLSCVCEATLGQEGQGATGAARLATGWLEASGAAAAPAAAAAAVSVGAGAGSSGPGGVQGGLSPECAGPGDREVDAAGRVEWQGRVQRVQQEETARDAWAALVACSSEPAVAGVRSWQGASLPLALLRVLGLLWSDLRLRVSTCCVRGCPRLAALAAPARAQ